MGIRRGNGMKKDIEWLKEEIWKQNTVMNKGYIYTDDLISIINEVDEPEVKQLDKKIRELESYNDELIIDNKQLRITLDNQEVLSQEWIENHSASADTISYYSKDNVPVVTAFNLKGLLMPKQEEIDLAYKDGYEKGKESEKPVEAVKEYFKSVEKSKEVLEELGYVVSEKPQKPVIPQFVADYIEKWKYEGLIMHEWFTFDHDDQDEDKVSKWLYNNDDETNKGREFMLIEAIRYGYEVEKEKRHRIVLPLTVWDEDASELNETTMFLAFDITSGETRFSPSAGKNGDYRTDLTESQIKAIDERYLAFKEEVAE